MLHTSNDRNRKAETTGSKGYHVDRNTDELPKLLIDIGTWTVKLDTKRQMHRPYGLAHSNQEIRIFLFISRYFYDISNNYHRLAV